jgi:hypothetical protein
MPDPIAHIEDRQFIANGIRLSGYEWLAVGLLVALFVVCAPAVWRDVEELAPTPDYRVPKASSEDYWLFDRWARHAASAGDVLVVGDSVVWGEYVAPDETLTHFLSEGSTSRRFANLGLAGMHPAPLAGLVEHYGAAISETTVVLHLNLLWMSSPRHDLRETKAFQFNHPLLVPQLYPRIPCYTASESERIGNVVKRSVPFFGWTGHLQIAYFDHQAIPEWTLEHPYESPWSPLRTRERVGDETFRSEARSWIERGIPRQDLDWVELETSLQWHSFQRTVEVLRERGNRLLVLVGPINTHHQTDAGRVGHDRARSTAEHWLQGHDVPYLAPDALPSELYADASHPLRAGYAHLARELLEHELLTDSNR